MNFPKLKHALLCRILVYVVVLGSFIAPIVLVAGLYFVPLPIKVIVGVGLGVGLLIYMIKNFVVLMSMDILLAKLHCNNTARASFVLPDAFRPLEVEKKISHFGKGYKPLAITPSPNSLRYKSNAPITVYTSGIERVILTYHTDRLDKNQYHTIFRSATANSDALKGKRKHFLDKSQKKSPLCRATAIIIFAKTVEESFRDKLYKKVCQNDGDGIDTAVIACVLDLEKGVCVFNSERLPYIGYQYPAKNRGIRLVRKYVFKGRLPLAESPARIEPIKDIDPEESLWSFWKNTKKEMITDEKETRLRYEAMQHGEILFDDGFLYLKWEENGVWVAAEMNEERKTVEIDPITSWYYPRPNLIAKDTIAGIKYLIDTYFSKLGYTTKYIELE